MVDDAAVPAGLRPSATATVERHGVFYRSARWTPDILARLARELATLGRASVSRLPDSVLLDAWSETVEEFLDPSSAPRRHLAEPLARFCGLSPAGLAAGLEAVLGGVGRDPAGSIFARAQQRVEVSLGGPPVLVVLAANLPALAVQPLLPSLALRRPVLLKSPSSEPLFAPAFITALKRRLPELDASLAAITWPGGDSALEKPLLEASDCILAYGTATTIADLERRARGQLVAYGPKISLAILGAGVDPGDVAAGLARDIALFDQRGCLSIHAVYTAGEAPTLAVTLAEELDRLADLWPPGPLNAVAAAAVQQLRTEATMRGLHRPELPLGSGTVIVEPQADFRPSPGLRTVRVHPLRGLERLPRILAPWEGRLQGAALAGEEAWALQSDLQALGISRCASPGQLQRPDAAWHNGGVHPLAVLSGRPATGSTGC